MNEVRKKKLGIISDSTCDMDPKFLKKYNIRTVPLKVIFGENEIRYQGKDITNEEFYKRLREGEMPSTAAPSPKAFVDAIEEALAEYEEVLVFCIGNKLSATYSVASMVKKQFFDERVTIIDTNTLSITMSLIILPAARMIANGAKKDEVMEFVNNTIPHTQVFGGAESLKYLHKGGRLSKVSYLIGSVLNLTPLITVDEGQVASPGKVRGFDAVIDRMKKVAIKLEEDRKTELVIVGHCDNEEKAIEIAEFLKNVKNAPKDIQVWEIGPVIGTHLGPGTVGFVWVGDFDKDWFKSKLNLKFWDKGSDEVEE